MALSSDLSGFCAICRSGFVVFSCFSLEDCGFSGLICGFWRWVWHAHCGVFFFNSVAFDFMMLMLNYGLEGKKHEF